MNHMVSKKVFRSAVLVILVSIGLIFLVRKKSIPMSLSTEEQKPVPTTIQHPLSVEYMRKQQYPGSDFIIEETLDPGSGYSRSIVSYLSQGLKQYALLTVPVGDKPPTGWPVIIFNHGYIPPEQYRTTERYIAYIDAFARNGYIIVKPDYRGHGNSKGNPEGAYYSPAYTIDVLNAVSSIKRYVLADPKRIAMWGHSMGGMVTLRAMVVSQDIRAADIWAGVAVSYQDLATNWHRNPGNPSHPFVPSNREQSFVRPNRQALLDTYGDFSANPTFWKSIAPIYYVNDLHAPIQLQHGSADEEVPILFSTRVKEALEEAGKDVTLYVYDGDDHNISNNLRIALTRSIDFFDSILKQPGK